MGFGAQFQYTRDPCGLHIYGLLSLGEAGQDSGEGYEFPNQTRFKYWLYCSLAMGLWAS